VAGDGAVPFGGGDADALEEHADEHGADDGVSAVAVEDELVSAASVDGDLAPFSLGDFAAEAALEDGEEGPEAEGGEAVRRGRVGPGRRRRQVGGLGRIVFGVGVGVGVRVGLFLCEFLAGEGEGLLGLLVVPVVGVSGGSSDGVEIDGVVEGQEAVTA